VPLSQMEVTGVGLAILIPAILLARLLSSRSTVVIPVRTRSMRSATPS